MCTFLVYVKHHLFFDLGVNKISKNGQVKALSKEAFTGRILF